MVELGPQFHWSPRERREEIRTKGLVPGSASLAGHEVLHSCAAPSPRQAWLLSGDTNWGLEQEDWDLWQVTLIETDELRVRADYGPRIVEVKIHNVIPPDRLWWVGERKPWLT